MTQPDASTIFDVVEATWPPAQTSRLGAWTLRDGKGGGKRVSATSLDGVLGEITAAEDAMQAAGQTPLFQVRNGQNDLDTALEVAGYRVIDPTNLYACPIEILTTKPLPIAKTYAVWEPLHSMTEVWAAGGIGPERLAVMDRAKGPKTGILGRWQDSIVGTGFVALHGPYAMVHAIEVLANQRGNGVGRMMMEHAAHWAQAQGATWMTLVATRANGAAHALYTSLGMEVVGQYHYRIKDPAE